MRKNVRLLIAGLTTLITMAAASSSYVVKSGDTLSTIALELGTSVSAIADANGITNPNRIYIGQELVIPGSDTYIVQPGDTLDYVASKTGTTVVMLAEANGITNPSLLYVGTQLQLTAPEHTFQADTGTATTHRRSIRGYPGWHCCTVFDHRCQPR